MCQNLLSAIPQSAQLMNTSFKKIMIFGRPGSGKSTFAYDISAKTGIPLHHLDKYFFVSNWAERDTSEFMKIQMAVVESDSWIIDGNSIHSLETRWNKADLVLYFNYPKLICLYRLIKRLFVNRSHIDDRAENCKDVLRFCLIKYMWRFDERVSEQIKTLKQKYPKTQYFEIKSDQDLTRLEQRLIHF